MIESLALEEKLLLILARRSPPALKEYIEDQCKSLGYATRVDGERIFRLALRNGVAPLVYLGVKDSGLFSEEVLAWFRNSYLATVASNLLKAAEIVRIIQALGERVIEVIPLKGPVAAEKFFGSLGLYPSGDIDILVKQSRVPEVGAVLQEVGGYCSPEGVSQDDLLASHYHLIYCNSNQTVEVHWNLVKRYFDIPSSFWWEGVRQGVFDNTQINELEPEKYLLYTIFRLFDHQFAPLKFLVLVAEQINSQSDIDWGKLSGYAERYGLILLVQFVLKLARELLDARIPESVINVQITGYGLLKRMVLREVTNERTNPHLKMFVFSCFLLPPAQLIRVLLGRLFPTASEIRLRYGIHERSLTVYFYYILNPFLLIFRRTR